MLAEHHLALHDEKVSWTLSCTLCLRLDTFVATRQVFWGSHVYKAGDFIRDLLHIFQMLFTQDSKRFKAYFYSLPLRAATYCIKIWREISKCYKLEGQIYETFQQYVYILPRVDIFYWWLKKTFFENRNLFFQHNWIKTIQQAKEHNFSKSQSFSKECTQLKAMWIQITWWNARLQPNC